MFKQKCNHHPNNLTEDEWDYVLGEIIWLFETVSSGKHYEDPEKIKDRLMKAKEYFAEYLFSLWL